MFLVAVFPFTQLKFFILGNLYNKLVSFGSYYIDKTNDQTIVNFLTRPPPKNNIYLFIYFLDG